MNEQPSIYKRVPRGAGYTFVTCPDFPGFSFMLEPGQDDAAMNSIFVQFLAYDIDAAKKRCLVCGGNGFYDDPKVPCSACAGTGASPS